MIPAARSWTLRYDERPWTANSARSADHWSKNATRTKRWRDAFHLLALESGLANAGPCRITVTPYLQRRPTQDVAACAPAAKAAIDGLVDAGVWPDDTPDYVVQIVFRAPVIGHGNALELDIESLLSATTALTWHTRNA